MIKILNQQKNILIDATNESILIGGKDLNCIMVTKSGSANGFLTAGIYNNEKEAQKIFDKLINVIDSNFDVNGLNYLKVKRSIIIEMPEKEDINEGEQGTNGTNDKI